MKTFIAIIAMTSLSSALLSDDLLDPYMSSSEYEVFIKQVSVAVSDHPEYLSSLDSLKAAGANLKGTKANLLPQIRLIVDSNNQLDKSFEDGANNQEISDHIRSCSGFDASC